jgi:hypothetical protein
LGRPAALDAQSPASGSSPGFVNHYGPSKTLAASLDDGRRAELERDFIAWHETFKKGLGFEQARQYIITRGRRR